MLCGNIAQLNAMRRQHVCNYHAKDPSPRVLKVVRRATEGRSFAEERDWMLALRHPNVVSIYNHSQSGWDVYSESLLAIEMDRC